MDDTSIIDLFWARNEEAIRETDRVYGRKLHVLSDRILNSREDARECVNDTYFKTWKIIPPQSPNHFYAFLCLFGIHLPPSVFPPAGLAYGSKTEWGNRGADQ